MPFAALIADDRDADVGALAKVLRAMGGEVSLVADCLTTLNALQAKSFNLVVLSTTMPDVDWLRTLPEVRRSGQANAYTPTIGFGADPAVDIGRYIQAGFYLTLPRPFQAWRLREAVHALGLALRPVGKRDASLRLIETLSSPQKRKLLNTLIELKESAVVPLAARIGRTRPSIQGDLDALMDVGLVGFRQEKRAHIYSVCSGEPLRLTARWLMRMADRLDANLA